MTKHDANSIHKEQGADALRDHFDDAIPFDEPPQANGHDTDTDNAKFKLVNIDDIVVADEPLFLIDKIIPAGPSLGEVFGKPKSGKSFALADMLFHVAMDRPYCGLAVQHGAVVYVTSEGIRGFNLRMIALRRRYDVEGKRVPFFVVNTMPDLGVQPGDAELLAQMIRATVPKDTSIAAVVIDTLARAMPGKNDSSSEDMSVFVQNCDIIAKALTCFVCAVHHSPRADDTRGRGSNALDAAADVLISVVKSDKVQNVSTMKVEEMKDGESGLEWKFRIEQVTVSEPGKAQRCAGVAQPITKPAHVTESATKRNPRRTATEQRFIDVLADCIDNYGEIQFGSDMPHGGVKVVTRDQFRKHLIDKGFFDTDQPNSIRAMFSKRLNELAGKQQIGTNDKQVWLPK